MGIGIVGAAMLGGAEGAGVGVATAGKNWTSELLEKEKQSAIALREESLARLNNEAAATRQREGFVHAEGQQNKSQAFQAVENELTRQQHVTDSALNRLSHEAIAKLGRDTQIAVSQMHGTVQVDKDGKIQWIGAGGKVVDTGLTSQKDLPPTAKVAADILRDQLKAIDKAENDVLNVSPEQQKTFAQQRTRINGQLLAVLTGDLNKAFATPEVAKTEPPTAAIAALKKDPSLANDFQTKYGVDPQQYLGKAGSQSASRNLVSEPPGTPVEPTEEELGAASQPVSGANAGGGVIGKRLERLRLQKVVEDSKKNPAVY